MGLSHEQIPGDKAQRLIKTYFSVRGDIKNYMMSFLVSQRVHESFS
jgi:hypothetical protein